MSDETVFLTGATGFVGGHVLRELLGSGRSVRALVREGTAFTPREGCTVVRGDVSAAGRLVGALEGCDAVVHVAAAYSFAPRDRAMLHRVNVLGTAGLLEAARIAGVPRAVVTSSSSTVGPERDGRPANEDDWAPPHGHSAYHESKIEQERAALAARVPAVLVLPTAPVGEGDARPTPTGRMIADFLRGRMIGMLPGGLNVVDVRDVARAHVAALDHGRPRERYLVGGENLTLDELWARLARIAGMRAPRLRVPYAAALAAGAADDLRCRLRGAEPTVPLEGVRMGRLRMFVDDRRARDELGHRPSPVDAALERAVRWHRGRIAAAA